MVADKKNRCGVFPFSLPEQHPFTPICKMHDQVFVAKEQGFPTGGRKRVDIALLSGMLGVAKERKSLSLKMQAYLYYGLARTFGKIFW